jgi:hypothetical protein
MGRVPRNSCGGYREGERMKVLIATSDRSSTRRGTLVDRRQALGLIAAGGVLAGLAKRRPRIG